MAWHAYMLNPRVYFEDGVNRKSRLLGIQSFPLEHFEKVIDTDTLVALHPSPERQRRFESLTGQPWICPLNTTLSDTTFIPCPRCENKTLNEVCWITNENTGFAQHDFKARCHACMGVFDRNAMMVRGLCDDIIQVRLGLTGKSINPQNQLFISGTLLNWKTGEPDYKGAATSNKVLLKHFLTLATMQFTRGDWLAGSIKFSIKKMETALKDGLNLRGGRAQVTRILSYYRCPYYPFSIELCGAILRQGSFIDKMVNLGWTEPRTFDDGDPIILVRCIARYNAWLDVMSQLTRKMLVPTLDLAWHTHQLKQQAYRTSTLNLLGQFIDHDDKIEENKLSDAYDQTAKYWELQQRWGIPYHVCGCPRPPLDKPFNPGETFSRIFRGKGKAPAEFYNNRPQLASTHDCDAPNTHPSEHNSILVVGQPLSETWRAARVKKRDKWDKQVRSDVSKGKVPPDGWEAMSLQRAEGHEQGFMRPVPNPNLTPVVPYGAETCAAHDGGVLYGGELSAAPTDGKYSAGACAAGMGLYGIMPIGGFYIGAVLGAVQDAVEGVVVG
ncbi:Dammaradiene synthase [Ceratobasidium theobromae]|uniref:Dammaradiene synthase n=1 Tax=Ceratobasidium theobromae TaxID=1582974 RepID=A0A5N5QE58_9AGAM|nr:Dammaradiene synthase [Ceratobasidium theobromae]